MPSTSIAQQRLMGQAYAVKTGAINIDDINPEYRDEIKKLSDSMTSQQLKDFASTPHEDLPVKKKSESYIPTFEEFVNERKLIENAHVNPGSTVIGMGPVKFPGNAGTTTQFAGQTLGSGDTSIPMFVLDTKSKDDEEKEKKRIKKLKDKLKNKD